LRLISWDRLSYRFSYRLQLLHYSGLRGKSDEYGQDQRGSPQRILLLVKQGTTLDSYVKLAF